MSFAALFQPFKDQTRIVLNDRFIGDAGAKQLSIFLQNHRRIQSIQLKSNDITSQGFIIIFEQLQNNPNVKHIILQYNSLGQDQYRNWQDQIINLLHNCPKIQRLNISNNKITNESFIKIVGQIACCKNLKLLELRYNNIQNSGVEKLLEQLKEHKNQNILYIELTGNKIRRQIIQKLQSYLKANRLKNPVSRDKLIMIPASVNQNQYHNSRKNVLQDISLANVSKENVLKHLEQILNQNRRNTADMKIRMQRQLEQLQKRQKIDARELNQLDNKCNQLLIQNRNLKYQLDRTLTQHQQIQRDQQYHIRTHQQKLRQANTQLLELQSKYQQIQIRMNKQHQLKMKQIARQWENRLRIIQEKIRMIQNQNHLLDNQIRKNIQKRQRLKVQYLDQQRNIRTRVQQQQSQRYKLKLSTLQSKLKEIQQSRHHFLKRNQDLIYQLEKTQNENTKNILDLQHQYHQLKDKQDNFLHRNKQFITKNQKLKSQISLKQITIDKLQEQVNRLNHQIQVKKGYNRQQIQKVIHDSEYDRRKKQQQKQYQVKKLNELEASLRSSQLQHARLRQQYSLLAQKLQVGLGRAVQEVFSQNSLY